MKFSTLLTILLLPIILLTGCSGEPRIQNKTIPEWLAELDSPDETRRLAAIGVLAEEAKPAAARRSLDPRILTAFETGLKDRASAVRLKAALALAWLGRDGGLTVPVLVEAMRDSGIRAAHLAAAQAIALRGRNVESSLSLLLRIVQRSLPELTPLSAAQLGQRNPAETRKALAAASAKLAGPGEPQILAALDELGRAGMADPALAVPAIIKQLGHTSPAVRRAAVDALGRLGTFAFPALADLTRILTTDPDPAVRAAVARIVMGIDPQSGNSVFLLTVAMRDADPAVRRAGARGLSEFGPSARAITTNVSADLLKTIVWPHNLAMHLIQPAIQPLINALADKDAGVRAAAAETLGGISPDIEKVVPPLLGATSDPDPAVRAAAARALGELAPGLGSQESSRAISERLAALLKDPDPIARAAALTATVHSAHNDGAVVPVLETMAKDAAPAVQWAMLEAMAEIGPASVSASKPLEDTLLALAHSPDPRLRAAAAPVLARDELRTAQALTELSKALEDKSPEVAEAAAEALGWMGPAAERAAEPLRRAIAAAKKPTPRAALTRTIALGWIAPQTTETVHGVLRGMQEPEFWQTTAADEPTSGAAAIRAAIIGVNTAPWREGLLLLGWRGPEAWSAAPALAGLLRDGQNPLELRLLAGMSLAGMTSSPMTAQIPPLFRQLRAEYATCQVSAATGLVWLGDKAAAALPELLRTLQSHDNPPELRMAAAAAVGKMGSAAAGVIPDLCDALRNEENPRVKEAVATILGGMGSGGKTATSPLIAALKNPDAGVREAAALALGKIGQDGAFAVPTLTAALQDAEPRVRLAAAMALGGFGAAARSAQAPLQALANSDADPLVRKAARGTLKKITVP